MGLIKAVSSSVGGVLADQWVDFFSCDAIAADTLIVKGQRYTGGRGSNKKGSDNVITKGSGIVVAEGQAAAVVDNGRIVEFTAEPGEFTFDTSIEPTVFAGGELASDLEAVFQTMIERFTYGGSAGKDQRVYYFNTKEIMGNKYGTPNPIPFRVVDTNIGLDMDTEIRCNGEYSFKLVNPILFYRNVAGNVQDEFTVEEIASQLKAELLTALQPAFAKISAMGIRYSALAAHTQEIADALNEQLTAKLRDIRGIEIVSFGVNSVSAPDEDEQIIKDLQKGAVLRDPGMAAATLAAAQADAMKAAASNDSGAMMGFMGLNMAQQAGGANAGQLFDMAEQNKQAATGTQPAPGNAAAAGAQASPGNALTEAAADSEWTCPKCGHAGNKGKFCEQCGAPRPAEETWTCPRCGHTGNKGNFCEQCGAPKP
ncbi:MAG: SPFH domain-containing protein [Clostridiales Family XIII bacterium]|jgi:membrane protease subunit (stomatin/prohibitin family)|nr:SPFH domain-containing protein [Clostridiales Family XIII bacterium]